MEIAILIWLAFGVVSAVIASNKGNSGCMAFIMGVLLGPIGFLISLGTSANKDELRKRSGDTKQCPYCAEYVKKEAIVCKHCGRRIEDIDSGFNIENFRR
jgi:hypothetical protein